MPPVPSKQTSSILSNLHFQSVLQAFWYTDSISASVHRRVVQTLLTALPLYTDAILIVAQAETEMQAFYTISVCSFTETGTTNPLMILS